MLIVLSTTDQQEGIYDVRDAVTNACIEVPGIIPQLRLLEYTRLLQITNPLRVLRLLVVSSSFKT